MCRGLWDSLWGWGVQLHSPSHWGWISGWLSHIFKIYISHLNLETLNFCTSDCSFKSCADRQGRSVGCQLLIPSSAVCTALLPGMMRHGDATVTLLRFPRYKSYCLQSEHTLALDSTVRFSLPNHHHQLLMMHRGLKGLSDFTGEDFNHSSF